MRVVDKYLDWIWSWMPVAVALVVVSALVVVIVLWAHHPELRAHVASVLTAIGRYARRAFRWLLPAAGAAAIIIVAISWVRHIERSAASKPAATATPAPAPTPTQNPSPQNPPAAEAPGEEAALRGQVEELKNQVAAFGQTVALLTSKLAGQGAAPSALNASSGAFLVPQGTIASQTNNPLNIKYSAQVAAIGGTDSGKRASDGGTFASFATPEDGLRAAVIMLKDPSFGYARLTVEAALRRWNNGDYGARITNIPANTFVSTGPGSIRPAHCRHGHKGKRHLDWSTLHPGHAPDHERGHCYQQSAFPRPGVRTGRIPHVAMPPSVKTTDMRWNGSLGWA